MKYLLINVLLLVPFLSFSQKIGKNKYRDVDSMITYRNADIIIYKQKGKVCRDTIWAGNVEVDNCVEMVINDNKILSKKHKP